METPLQTSFEGPCLEGCLIFSPYFREFFIYTKCDYCSRKIKETFLSPNRISRKRNELMDFI